MKHFILWALLLTGLPICAQDMPKTQEAAKPPELAFHVVPDFFKIPSDMIMAEAVGVAINSKGHIFILNRGNHPLLEFDSEGAFIGSFGVGSPLFRVPHSIRFDAQGNLWYVAAGDNLVVKFDQNRRAQQALGRREGDKRIYVACNDFSVVYSQKDADHYEEVGRVPTGFRAKTAIYVPQLKRYYVAAPRHGNEIAKVLVFEIQ